MSTLVSPDQNSATLTLREIHETILDVSKRIEPYTIQTRRKLHMYPELGWQEEKTLAFIKNEIIAAIAGSPLHFELTEKEGGLWLDMTVSESAPRVLFRADIDALPIQEENEVDYASRNPGVMHACGHDCHTAMLLAALKAIGQGWVLPRCNIRFVFQRAEEVGGQNSGGSLLVRDGVCDGIDHAYCLHIGAKDIPGIFLSKPGMQFCNPTSIEIEIEAEGGHVASPFIGTNTIDVLTSIVSELRGIERLLFTPSEPIVFVPSVLHSGEAPNIRPNQAKVIFALRSYLSDEKKEMFINHVKLKVESIISSFVNTKLANFKVSDGYPILINDPRSTRFVSSSLNALGYTTDPDDLSFAGDDFAYYLQKARGSYWVLGAWQENGLDHHTAKFNPDEAALHRGVGFWLLLASRIPA